MSTVFFGSCISSGHAAGPLFYRRDTAVSSACGCDPAAEQARFQEALRLSDRELSDAYDRIAVHDPAFAEICAELERHGYHRAAENLFSLSDAVPRLLLPLPADAEYVGAGPGAVSRIDGFAVHNTADFETWCRNCGDWRRLVVKAEPV